MLNPTVKHWFEMQWTKPRQEGWLDRVLLQVKELWKDQYKPMITAIRPTAVADDHDNLHIRLQDYKRPELTPSTPLLDQFDEYLSKDVVPESADFNLLQYWYERRHTSRIPLSRTASNVR